MRTTIAKLKRGKQKKLIVFDFDGTLVPTKSPLDSNMDAELTKLLTRYQVAVIGGNSYEVLKELFLSKLAAPKTLLKNLFIFPTTGTAFYQYQNGWKRVYQHTLTAAEVRSIRAAFEQAFQELHYVHPKKVYGELIENRGAQVSFSVFGQDLVTVLGKRGVAMKEQWKKKHNALKMRITERVAQLLPKLEVRAAGFTTIDVTRKGIDKAYGLGQMTKRLKIKPADMLFVGDAIFPGGNDYAVVKTKVDYIAVKDPEETKRVITVLLGGKDNL